MYITFGCNPQINFWLFFFFQLRQFWLNFYRSKDIVNATLPTILPIFLRGGGGGWGGERRLLFCFVLFLEKKKTILIIFFI